MDMVYLNSIKIYIMKENGKKVLNMEKEKYHKEIWN